MRQQTLPSLAKDFLIIFLAYHNSLAHPKALLCGQHRKELRALYKLHMHACNHTNFQVNFFWKTQRSILLNQRNEVSKYVCKTINQIEIAVSIGVWLNQGLFILF